MIASVVVLRRRDTQRASASVEYAAATGDAGRALLLSWGLVPLAFMPAVGLVMGADLQLQWGTPFLLFAVPAAMELASTRIRWSGVPLRPALKVFVGLQLLLIMLSQVTSLRGITALQDHHWRGFDSAELAKALEQPARAALGGKIDVVSGPAAPVGALALKLEDRPRVMIDGRADRSPWITSDMAKQCGVLELAFAGALPGSLPVGSAFPGLTWRATRPAAHALPCPG